MPEEIKNFKEAIATIPVQSLMAAEVARLEGALKRTRSALSRARVWNELKSAKRKHNAYLISIGRPTAHDVAEE